ncbi:hypothetical protein C8R45DRAFT_926871 [Mycena sanguinolenta]|nr:hypothetical protein C8R45DRAFT_926871 [Mycena sanguinolenta]
MDSVLEVMSLFWHLSCATRGVLTILGYSEIGGVVPIHYALMKSPGLGPGSGLQAPHPGLGLGPGESGARARPSQARARAFRPSRALNITTLNSGDDLYPGALLVLIFQKKRSRKQVILMYSQARNLNTVAQQLVVAGRKSAIRSDEQMDAHPFTIIYRTTMLQQERGRLGGQRKPRGTATSRAAGCSGSSGGRRIQVRSKTADHPARLFLAYCIAT